jgi:hypothetical protein
VRYPFYWNIWYVNWNFNEWISGRIQLQLIDYWSFISDSKRHPLIFSIGFQL